MEIWKDIEGYEDKYQVSNLGRVKSLKNTRGNYREKILKPGKDGKGEKNYNIKKIICVTTGEVFNYMSEAVVKYNLDPSNLTKCCRGKIKYCGKHPVTRERLVWEYYEE